jgi:hypothetical protein
MFVVSAFYLHGRLFVLRTPEREVKVRTSPAIGAFLNSPFSPRKDSTMRAAYGRVLCLRCLC